MMKVTKGAGSQLTHEGHFEILSLFENRGGHSILNTISLDRTGLI